MPTGTSFTFKDGFSFFQEGLNTFPVIAGPACTFLQQFFIMKLVFIIIDQGMIQGLLGQCQSCRGQLSQHGGQLH